MEKYLAAESTTKKLVQRISFFFGGQSSNPTELIRNLSVKEMLTFGNAYPITDTLHYEDEFRNLFGNSALCADVQVYTIGRKEMGKMINTSTFHVTDNKHLEY